MKQEENIAYLTEICNTARTGMERARQVQKKTKDTAMKAELYQYVGKYKAIMEDASRMIRESGGNGQSASTLSAAQVWMETSLGTVMDHSDSRLASVALEGEAKDYFDHLKSIKEHPSAGYDVKRLAAELAQTSQDYMDRMKHYL